MGLEAWAVGVQESFIYGGSHSSVYAWHEEAYFGEACHSRYREEIKVVRVLKGPPCAPTGQIQSHGPKNAESNGREDGTCRSYFGNLILRRICS